MAAAALSLVPVTLRSAPAVSGARPPIEPAPPPHPTEVALLDELSAWAEKEQARSIEIEWLRHDAERAKELVTGLPFGRDIVAAAQRADIDPLLLAAVVEVESRFDPNAVSPRGALGLLQVMPETALILGLADATEPTSNLAAGAHYLSEMLRRRGGDLPEALAAYNAGPGAVERWDGVPPFGQTHRYIERVMRTYLGHLRAVAELEPVAQSLGVAAAAAPVG